MMVNGTGPVELSAMEPPPPPPPLLNGLHHDLLPTNGLLLNGPTADKPAGMEYSTGDRVKRKAKRLTKFLAKELVTETATVTNRQLKNSRKSRNGQGRGLPKKGGAGGKGTWGVYGSELRAEAALDYKDPNYDSESLDNGDIHLEAIIPELTDEELQKNVEEIVLEYFEHGDPNEVLAAIDEVPLGQRKAMVLVIAVEAAMDHKPSHREMTSQLISVLAEEFLEDNEVVKGFEKLLENLTETILDVPEAPTLLGNFIARAVADDCLLNTTVHGWKDKMISEQAKAAVHFAEVLLIDKVGVLRLNNVWGVGGGAQPVKALSRRIYMLLKEFLSSNDTMEAGRCLRELEVPHFHHELVYEAIVMALESMQESTEESICRLLKALFNTCIITPDQMQRGFFRVFEDLPDLCIDIPAAYTLVDRFVQRAQRHGVVGEDIVLQVPVRGRKRFVSEGDGGKVKDENIRA